MAIKRGSTALLMALLLIPACSQNIQLNTQPLAENPKVDRIQDLSMAISRSPRNPKFYVDRSQAYEKNGEYKSALADLNQAIALSPDNAQYFFLRGIAYAYIRRPVRRSRSCRRS